jgi:hypothetical protein
MQQNIYNAQFKVFTAIFMRQISSGYDSWHGIVSDERFMFGFKTLGEAKYLGNKN